MGTRGPVPKRSDERLGHPSVANPDAPEKVPAGIRKPVWPKAKAAFTECTCVTRCTHVKDMWHTDARRWYLSLRQSGQSQFYEQSDMAVAYFIAGQMSDYLRYNRKGAQMFSAILTGMSSLLNTEADRRRVGIELVREPIVKADPASVAMTNYMKMLEKRPAAHEVGLNDVPPVQGATNVAA